jgi:hypothetical protein
MMLLVYILGGIILGVGALVLGVSELVSLKGPGETITHTVKRLPRRSRLAVIGGCFLIAAGGIALGLHFMGLF